MSGDSTPDFSVDLARKDLRLAIGLAADLGIVLPVASKAEDVLNAAHDIGLGPLDMTAAVRVYETAAELAFVAGPAGGLQGG